MLGRRQPRPRRFSYTPYFYDPKKEEEKGTRIRFKRYHSKRQAKTRSLIWLFMVLFIVLYVIFILSRIGK